VIQGLQYHFNGHSVITEAIKVYMANTTLQVFPNTTSWIPVSQMTLVFDGTITTTNQTPGLLNNWIDIPLDDYFIHDPAQNLVIAVFAHDGIMHPWQNFWNCHAVTGNRSMTH
jgi:hypothetical protein